jgi:predicted pyridoxine 5'-phosphate oxidase superfamily flavin-nucleotide-binding protein
MSGYTSDVAFTSAVKAWQERRGSRKAYARMEAKGGWRSEVTPELADFLAERESFYLATASAEGQPYVQHRGGPKGFLKVLDARRLAFADFGGNKQYISAGNLSENDRAQIFLMDYAGRRRIKVWGRARVVEDDPALLERLADPVYKAKPERAIVFDIEAWDVNCPQHILPRYTEEQIKPAFAKLEARILELEAEVERLEGELAVGDGGG